MNFIYRVFFVIQALFNSSLFLISLAFLTFGFAVSMKMLAVSWMRPKMFWFFIGLGLGFLLVPLAKTLVRNPPPTTTSENDA